MANTWTLNDLTCIQMIVGARVQPFCGLGLKLDATVSLFCRDANSPGTLTPTTSPTVMLTLPPRTTVFQTTSATDSQTTTSQSVSIAPTTDPTISPTRSPTVGRMITTTASQIATINPTGSPTISPVNEGAKIATTDPTAFPTTSPSVGGDITTTATDDDTKRKKGRGNVNIYNKYYIYGNNNKVINNNHFNNKYIGSRGHKDISCPCFDVDKLLSKEICSIDYMGGHIIRVLHPNAGEAYKKEYMILFKNNACQYIISNEMIINKRSIDPDLFSICLNIISQININPCGSSAQTILIKTSKDIEYILKGNKGVTIKIGLIITIIVIIVILLVSMYYISKCIHKKIRNKQQNEYSLIAISSHSENTSDE